MAIKNYHERNFWLGTRAERLTVTPGENAYWIEEDTGTLWAYYSGIWVPITGGGGGGAPTEGPGIDIIAMQVGLGGDTVLLYDDGGLPVAEFATITLALAASASGNLVYVPPGIFIENVTIPNGVSMVSMGNNSLITGSVTMVGTSHMKGMLVLLTANSAGTLVGVTGPAAGTGRINDCGIVVTNTGAGEAYGIQGGAGTMEIRDSSIDANADSGDAIGLVSGDANMYSFHNDLICISISGDGYCFYTAGNGDIYAIGGYAWASTSPIGV